MENKKAWEQLGALMYAVDEEPISNVMDFCLYHGLDSASYGGAKSLYAAHRFDAGWLTK